MTEESGRPVGLAPAALLLLGSCLPIMGAVLLAPLLPLIQQAFAGTPGVGELTLVTLSAPALAIALISPFAGAVADRYGRKRLLVIALPLYTLVGTAPLYLSSLPLIVGSRFLLGATEAVIMTICTTLLGDYFHGARRERMLAMQTILASVSAVVFVLAGGALGAQGWRAPFWLYGAGLVLAPLAAWLLWEPMAADRPAQARESVPWARLAPLYGLTLVMAVVFYVTPAQSAFLLRAVGNADPGVAGMVNGAAQASILVGSAAFTLIRRRLGFGAINAAGFVIAGAGLIGLGRAGDVGAILPMVIVNGLGLGLLLPGLVAWVIGLLSLEQRGRGTGGFTAAFFFGQFLSPLIVVALSHPLQGLQGAVEAIGVAALAAAPFALVISRTLKPLSSPGPSAAAP